jgi:hypothetical protein
MLSQDTPISVISSNLHDYIMVHISEHTDYALLLWLTLRTASLFRQL